MEELTKLDLLEISPVNEKEYLLTLNVNGKKKKFTAYIEMTAPIFGVNFSDDFLYILRNYRSDIQRLIKIIKNLSKKNSLKLPVSLLKAENVPELQVA